MSTHYTSIQQWIKNRACKYTNVDYIGEKYTYTYILVAFAGLLFTPYLPSSIGTGLLTAAAIFAIHEAVKVRFAVVIDTLSERYPNSFAWVKQESYVFIGGAVFLDLLIAVPMFSSDAYAWAYTRMIIFYIFIFIFYTWLAKLLLVMIRDTIEKINDIAESISDIFEQLMYSFDKHPAISPKYSKYLQKVSDHITPLILLVIDIILLVVCLSYVAIYHPHLVQLNATLWVSEMQNPTNPSMILFLSEFVILVNILAIHIVLMFIFVVLVILLFIPLIPLLLLLAPGLVWEGLEGAPTSIHIWGAISVLILAVIYFTPPVLEYISSSKLYGTNN